MLRVKKILKILVIITLPISLQAFASSRNYLRSVKEVKVVYLGSENMYVTDQAIRKLLFQAASQRNTAKNFGYFQLGTAT
ncbi:Cell division protein FtsQ (fragment) [Capnocytophaga canimorsus]|uniref:Cell division protein FtsQ n=1 Tax=Capnocytophaga canimorsus TaxID=28188 RepID=A0A0B7HSF4_9FLAO